MTQFVYTALDKTGKRLSGTLDASTEFSVTQVLRRRELRPLTITPAKGNGLLSKLTALKIGGNKIKLKDLVIFTRQLSTMINAGVPLSRSLATLQAQTDNEAFREHISQISKEVEGGNSFADALEKHPNIFTPIYVNMVRAGEAGGILDEILRKLAEQQEKDAHIRGKLKSAMTYPIVLLTITISVFFGLMVFAMPKIGSMIQELAGPEAELPTLTKVLVGISSFMTTYWYIMIGTLFVTSFLVKRYIKTPKGRYKKDRILLKIPVINTIIKKVAIARFARIFASLMSAGVTVLDSIQVTSRAIGNTAIEEELMRAYKEVSNGQQLSVPLASSDIFPPIVSQMLSIGEETGKTDVVLIKVADFYEEEVDAVVDSMSSIIEPVMIVIMGGMVGLIAAGVIGPISNLSSQL